MIFSSKTLFVLVVVCLCLQYTTSVKLSKGTLQLTITEEHKDNIEHNIKIHEKIATTLELTQSSRVKVQTRVLFIRYTAFLWPIRIHSIIRIIPSSSSSVLKPHRTHNCQIRQSKLCVYCINRSRRPCKFSFINRNNANHTLTHMA